jgi:hypothetical protein
LGPLQIFFYGRNEGGRELDGGRERGERRGGRERGVEEEEGSWGMSYDM